MRTLRCIASVGAIILCAPAIMAQTTPPAPPAQVDVTPLRTPTYAQPETYRPREPGALAPFDRINGAGPFAQSKYYEQTYELAQQFGRCASNVSPKRARLVLNAAPNTRTELVELNQLSGLARACLPYAYRAPVVFLRGSLAEAMYKRQPTAQTTHSVGVRQSALDAFQTAETARSTARLPDDRSFSIVTNCLAVRSPDETRAVLMSEHGSQSERQAIKQLIASAPGCTGSTAFPVTAGTSFIRAYLAESALHWADFDAQRG